MSSIVKEIEITTEMPSQMVPISGNRSVTVTELTPAQIMTWFEDFYKRSERAASEDLSHKELFEELFCEDLPLDLLQIMVTPWCWMELGHKQRAEIVEAAKELNPDFLKFRARLRGGATITTPVTSRN
ncbi:MAG: hypothetical protein ACR2QC_02420 [Gammaproteobacteria bacterium]